jgi:hypothetical protein
MVNITGGALKLPVFFVEILSRVETCVHWHHISDYSSEVLTSLAAARLAPTLHATHGPTAVLPLLT